MDSPSNPGSEPSYIKDLQNIIKGLTEENKNLVSKVDEAVSIMAAARSKLNIADYTERMDAAYNVLTKSEK